MDSDLDAIRQVRPLHHLPRAPTNSVLPHQKRMAELQASGGGAPSGAPGGGAGMPSPGGGPGAGGAGGSGEDKAQQAAQEDERRRAAMSQILSSEARERRASRRSLSLVLAGALLWATAGT